MKLSDIKIEHIAILVLILLLLNSCPGKRVSEKRTRVVKTDTILLKKIDSLSKLFKDYKQVKPEVVYVKIKDNKLKRLSPQEVTKAQETESKDLLKLNEYKDTIQNKDLTIYSNILTDGKIYENNIKYELNYPVVKETITETIERNNSGLFIYSGIETSQLQLQGVNVGLQYVHKNNWLVGYGVGYSQNQKINHHIKIGLKLF